MTVGRLVSGVDENVHIECRATVGRQGFARAPLCPRGRPSARVASPSTAAAEAAGIPRRWRVLVRATPKRVVPMACAHASVAASADAEPSRPDPVLYEPRIRCYQSAHQVHGRRSVTASWAYGERSRVPRHAVRHRRSERRLATGGGRQSFPASSGYRLASVSARSESGKSRANPVDQIDLAGSGEGGLRKRTGSGDGAGTSRVPVHQLERRSLTRDEHLTQQRFELLEWQRFVRRIEALRVVEVGNSAASS